MNRGRIPMTVRFKGAHFPKAIILTCVRWYVDYPLSTRHVEELMQERGVTVDHATINKKPLLVEAGDEGLTAAAQFYALAA
jgi:hypothetical protein